MLHEQYEPFDLTSRWAGRSLPRRVMAQWLRQGAAPEDPQPRWFTDDPARPQVVLRLQGCDCWVNGPAPLVAEALADLRTGRLRGDGPWPDPAAEAEWAKTGRRELRLGRSPRHALDSARRIGLTDPPEQRQPHYQARAWYVAGRPRFAHLVQHPCRVVEGEELLEFMLAGEHRENVNYQRECLRRGPSFVCEVAGVGPVCSSFTHLGGPLGGIFTPPEHRGKGYGKSVTALQVDTVLERQGLAVASIRLDNAASYRMLLAVGGRHIRGPLTWSTLLWG
jgi:hypothetical protein